MNRRYGVASGIQQSTFRIPKCVKMSDQLSGMSSVKLGLAVAWPAFWVGIPFKLVIALLFLAMGVHPWEGAGLAFLLLLSVPIDIWALGLAARTVFLERLRLEPPASIGLTLWWQCALVSAVYLPLLYFVASGTVVGTKAVTHKIMGLLESLPIAEKISLELVLWGSVTTVVLLILFLGWLFIVGRIVRRQAAAGSSSADSYQGLVHRWDLMRVPADQSLLLTVFAGTGILVVLCFWGFLPVTTPHPHEDYEMPEQVVRGFKPVKALDEAEKALGKAEATLQALEGESKGSKKGKGKAAGKKGQ